MPRSKPTCLLLFFVFSLVTMNYSVAAMVDSPPTPEDGENFLPLEVMAEIVKNTHRHLDPSLVAPKRSFMGGNIQRFGGARVDEVGFNAIPRNYTSGIGSAVMAHPLCGPVVPKPKHHRPRQFPIPIGPPTQNLNQKMAMPYQFGSNISFGMASVGTGVFLPRTTYVAETSVYHNFPCPIPYWVPSPPPQFPPTFPPSLLPMSNLRHRKKKEYYGRAVGPRHRKKNSVVNKALVNLGKERDDSEAAKDNGDYLGLPKEWPYLDFSNYPSFGSNK